MKNWKKSAILALAAVSVCAAGALAVGCGEKQETTENNVEVSQALKEAALDLHVKQGEAVSAQTPDGITVDVSKVNTQVAGSYKIVYQKGKERLAKTAFVYGAPVFTCESERTIAYAEANALDFLSAEDFNVAAEDSFGRKLDVKATPDRLYLGEYGEYTITYEATDYAGNVTTVTVKYTVQGTEAPEVKTVTADVLDETVAIDVTFGTAAFSEVTFDGIPLKISDFDLTDDGIVLDAALVERYGLRDKETYEVLIKTNEWCAETAVRFEDKMPSVLPEFECYNNIYLLGEKIVLPVPTKQTRQGYEIVYEFNGNEVALDQSGNTVTLDVTALGEYTLTATAKQTGKEDVVQATKFTVYDQENYDRIVAPLNTQFTGDLTVRSENWGRVFYDSEMKAYKREALWNEGDGHSALMFVSGSRAFKNMMNGYAKYPYLAIDLCFDGTIGVDFTSFAFYINGGWGKAPVQLNFSEVFIYDTDGYGVQMNQMQGGKWYTVYVPVTESIADYAGWGYYFMTQMSKISDTPPAEGKTGYKYTDYWIRNVRFENAKEEVSVNNGDVFEEGEVTLARLPRATQAYSILSAPEGAEIVNGNCISATAAGVYKVQAGTQVVTFTVYSKADYARLIAPLTSANGSLNGGFVPRHTAWATLSYDETRGAYKNHPMYLTDTTANGGRNNVWTGISATSETGTRFAANFSKYSYVAFDLCVDGTYKEDYTNFLFYMSGGSNGHIYQLHFDEVKKYDVSGKQITTVSATTFLANTWYTIYVPLDQTKPPVVQFEQYAFLTQVPVGESGNWSFADYWLRNVRFESALPTA